MDRTGPDSLAPNLSAAQLRLLPAEQRDPILAAAAALAESDYVNDAEVTAFDAFDDCCETLDRFYELASIEVDSALRHRRA
jgi:hypothetical protein